MKNLLIIFCVLLFLTGCSVDKEQEIPVISISSIIKDELTLSDIAEDIRYVKLDDSVLIGKIWKFQGMNSDFILYELGENILRYNSSGKLINKIGNKGKGPEEYNTVSDIALDPGSNRIFILGYKKVICYNVSSGRYEYSFKTFEDIYFERMAFFNSELYFFCNHDFLEVKYNWIVTDCKGDNARAKNNYFNPEITFKSNIDLDFVKNKNLFYWNYIDDTLFMVRQEQAIPAYLFVKEPLRIPVNKLMGLGSFEKLRESPLWLLNRVLGSDRFLTLKYIMFKDKICIQTIYDDKENKFYQLNTSPLDGSPEYPNSWDNGIGFLPETKIIDETGEWFVQYVDAYLLKAHVASDEFKNAIPKYPEKKKALEQLANSLKENDNPVLMLVKLKG